jgi:hypothetical protein
VKLITNFGCLIKKASNMKEHSLKPMKVKLSLTYSTVIYSFCMYCSNFMGTKDGGGISGISHGICKECEEKQPWK